MLCLDFSGLSDLRSSDASLRSRCASHLCSLCSPTKGFLPRLRLGTCSAPSARSATSPARPLRLAQGKARAPALALALLALPLSRLFYESSRDRTLVAELTSLHEVSGPLGPLPGLLSPACGPTGPTQGPRRAPLSLSLSLAREPLGKGTPKVPSLQKASGTKRFRKRGPKRGSSQGPPGTLQGP